MKHVFVFLLFSAAALFIPACSDSQGKPKEKKKHLDPTYVMTVDGDTLFPDYSSGMVTKTGNGTLIQLYQYKYSGEKLNISIRVDSVSKYPHKFIFAGPGYNNDNPGAKVEFNWRPRDWSDNIADRLHEYPTGNSELTITELDTVNNTLTGSFAVEVNSSDTKKYKTH